MHLISVGIVVALSALFAQGSVQAADIGSILPASVEDTGLTVTFGSLAWAGENETFGTPSVVPADAADERECNIEMLNAVVAPEPPAIVLAGMALGGLFFGRSMLRRNRKVVTTNQEDRS